MVYLIDLQKPFGTDIDDYQLHSDGWGGRWGIGNDTGILDRDCRGFRGDSSGPKNSFAKKGYAAFTDPSHPRNPVVKKDTFREFVADVVYLGSRNLIARTDYESVPSFSEKMPNGSTTYYRDGTVTVSMKNGARYSFLLVERIVHNPKTKKYAITLHLPNRDNSRMYTALRLGDRKLTDFTLSYHRSDGQVLPVFR